MKDLQILISFIKNTLLSSNSRTQDKAMWYNVRYFFVLPRVIRVTLFLRVGLLHFSSIYACGTESFFCFA